MIRIKKIVIKLQIRILLKGDTLKRVEFDEIFMVGTGDKLFKLVLMIDKDDDGNVYYAIWNMRGIVK